MTEIISVRFKEGGKDYYFNPNGVQYEPGQYVIIETSRGVEFGECTKGNSMIDERTLFSPLRPVLRAATEEDKKRVEANKKKEAEAFVICEKKIAEHGLDMKLVEVEYNFEGSKILFFFTSDGRVDFRELVRDLASIFHTRIELRQIGVRDEAKLLGGLGICGRPFCCSSFLDDFQPVSIKMAKTQNLSLNPTKISGVCGRLMCCLKYEQDAYEDALKRCPKNDSLVETPDGVGTICSVNLLRETAKVHLDKSPEKTDEYACAELKVIRSGKGKRPEGYELPEQPKTEHSTSHETSERDNDTKDTSSTNAENSAHSRQNQVNKTENTSEKSGFEETKDEDLNQKKKSKGQNSNRQQSQKKGQKKTQTKEKSSGQKSQNSDETKSIDDGEKDSKEQREQSSHRNHHKRKSNNTKQKNTATHSSTESSSIDPTDITPETKE